SIWAGALVGRISGPCLHWWARCGPSSSLRPGPPRGCPGNDARMGSGLLEREVELRALDAALARAVAGTGSVVLLFGEAGIGKTTVLRAFLRAAAGPGRGPGGGGAGLPAPPTP